MKTLIIAALLALSVQAWADTLHVRSVADCVANGCGAEDGSSYANAFRGTADVSQGNGAGQWGAGDTLCAYGTFTGTSEVDVSGITLRIDTSGTDANTRTTLDGDCDGDGAYATFDGGGAVGIGIRTAIVGTSRTTWAKVTRVNLTRYTNKAVVNYNVVGDETSDANQLWTYINITNHGDGGAGDNCFDSRGRYVELSNSTISGCDDDGVFHQGKYFRSNYLIVSDVSRATVTGDGLQIGGEGDGYNVTNFACDHSLVDAKQCFITSVLSDTGANGILDGAVMRCKLGAVSQNCVFVTGVNAIIRRVYTYGGQYGIAVEDSTDSNGLRLESSIATHATLTGVNVAGTNPTGITLIHNVAALNGTRGINITPTNAMTLQNNIAYNNGDDGISRGHASQVEQYNDSFGNGGDNFAIAGNATAAGTGSISVDPDFTGGSSPTTKEGFKILSGSPLIRAGTPINDPELRDIGGTLFNRSKPSIGAWEVGSGDFRSTINVRH